ncbi:ubiquitin-specific protease otu1 [Cadophora gregata f. sp. sojae]|nr:ubiquitin-specific protease otu1 [Cadophora gregata f. sp. sojae]
MRTRVRAPAGAFTITLPDDATIGDLISQITEKTSISRFDTKYGYPPKPLSLQESDNLLPLSKLGVKLDGEQLTISQKDDAPVDRGNRQAGTQGVSSVQIPGQGSDGAAPKSSESKLVALKRQGMEGDVPELIMPGRGTTVVLRVMPDDNSCLFRAFGTAVLPGDDQSMTELRSIIATAIQSEPETYSKVVLEQEPDDYCRWIQTLDAWGGAIEMGILANYFGVEVCSIDVQSLRIDRFNEDALTRCILVYSGIHYDTIAESPMTTDPEFDTKVWGTDDDEILQGALELCKKLQAKHYFTDTGGMAIKCNECGAIVYGEGQASGHAQQFGHYE